MGRYAKDTQVSRQQSVLEIERTLSRYGADSFMYGWEGEAAVVAFRVSDRRVRFELKMPSRDSEEFATTPTGRDRSESAALKEWEQACRQRWRALALAIKAKLEVVDSGIRTFEQEFGFDFVCPDGRTVGQHVLPNLDRALAGGSTRLLPSFTEER